MHHRHPNTVMRALGRSNFGSDFLKSSSRPCLRGRYSPAALSHSPYSVDARRRHADIIVVGAGIAGVSASIAATEKGASVILLDRDHGGGASALSGGVVYAGGGTDQQRVAGYGDDTPDNMYRYLKAEVKDAVDDETLRRFCDESASQLKWLELHGARFEGSLCPHKTSYPTDRHYLYYSGGEKSHPFNKAAKPAPRGHRQVSTGFSGGALWKALNTSAMELGIRLRPTSRVQRILIDEQGAATGVELKSLDPGSRAFRRHRSLTNLGLQFHLLLPDLAKRIFDRADNIWQRNAVTSKLNSSAVILAAGGFAFNNEMRKHYAPDYAKVAPLGTRGDDGSGIQLGQSVGGSISHMDNMSAWRFIYPPTALLEGVVVSQSGKRFIAEDNYGAALSDKLIRENNSTGFLVLDSNQWAKAKGQLFKQSQNPHLIQRCHWLFWDHKKASTIEDLSAKLGVMTKGLSQTISEYNDAITNGQKDPLDKEAEYCTPILKAPFYGIDISSQTGGVNPVIGLTLGGLRVDGKTGLVLREDDTRIENLYAAGRNAVGICSNGYVSGLSLEDGVFSGKRAAEHAASLALRGRIEAASLKPATVTPKN